MDFRLRVAETRRVQVGQVVSLDEKKRRGGRYQEGRIQDEQHTDLPRKPTLLPRQGTSGIAERDDSLLKVFLGTNSTLLRRRAVDLWRVSGINLERISKINLRKIATSDLAWRKLLT